jgi:hypothetical protein
MSGYTPEGFNGDDKEDWATDPEAPKAQIRTKEQVLGLTCSEILNLRGADLEAACVLLCMDDVTWNEEDQVWMRSNGGIFRPSSMHSNTQAASKSAPRRLRISLHVSRKTCSLVLICALGASGSVAQSSLSSPLNPSGVYPLITNSL